MARSLTQPPPSSSLARLLDAGAAARAVSVTTPATPFEQVNAGPSAAEAPGSVAGRDHDPVKRELTLTMATDDVFEQLVEVYRRATGTRLSSSQLARAMRRGLAHCLPSLQREANRIGRLTLPSNARGRDRERDAFERRIARAFIAGIRSVPAFQPE